MLAGLTQDCVRERAHNVHVRDRIAELVRPGCLRFDGPFADDVALVPAGARRLHVGEQTFEQLALEDLVRLRGELERAALLALFQTLTLRHLAEVNKPLKCLNDLLLL